MTGEQTSPLVSAVIPTRDRATLLEQAVGSVLRQTYERLEVVVVDDGSTVPLNLPSSLSSDPRVRTLRLEESAGPGAARNLGAASCRGSLIAFLDDDDRWRPTKIERQVETLTAAGHHVDAVESGFELWDGHRLVTRYVPALVRDVARTLLERPILQPSTVLMRTSVFEALGGFDVRLRRIEDWEFWVRFSDGHEVVALPEVLVDRTVSEPSGELPWYREIVRLLEPRIDVLPEPERSRIRSVHLLVEAHLLARAGDRRAMRRAAFRAFRECRSAWPRASLYIVRSLTGERVWHFGKNVLRATIHPVLRAAGRDLRERG
jgi:glycosyltransferase involved in cell wall biosynthesis